MKNLNKQKNSGFTLIELMVSVTLFSIVLMMSLGAVLTVIDLNRKTQAMASVTNNINFAVDSIIRIIKSAEYIVDRSVVNSTCIGVDNDNSQIKIKFIDTYGIFEGNPEDTKYISYRLNCSSGVLERGVSQTDNDPVSWDEITTSSDMEIVDAEFKLISTTQQKVEMLIKGLATVGSETSEFNIQTTATRRK